MKCKEPPFRDMIEHLKEGRTAGENHPLKPTHFEKIKKNFFPSFYLYLLFPLFFKTPMLSYPERFLGD